MNFMADLLQQPMGALLAIMVIIGVGDIVTQATKFKIPSTFVIALLFLVGYWTILPKDVIDIAGVGVIGQRIGTSLVMVHMGSKIHIRDFIRQWKLVAVALTGLVGMVVFAWFIGGALVDKQYLVTGIPPMTGGMIATLMVQEAAMEKGLTAAAVLAVCMLVMQGFVGYPLTGLMLRKEGAKLLKTFTGEMPDHLEAVKDTRKEKKWFPPVPAAYYTPAIALAKMAFLGIIAYYIQVATTPLGGFKIPVSIAALILGIIAHETGFIEENVLNSVKCFEFVMLALLTYIFGSLNSTTPQMVLEIAGPLAVIIILGVIGMGIASTIASKVMKVSVPLGFAVALTSLCGFPTCYILTEESSRAVAKTSKEYDYLMNELISPMMIGNMVTVTIASVFIAGFFIPFL